MGTPHPLQTLWVLEIHTGIPSGSRGSPSRAHPASRARDQPLLELLLAEKFQIQNSLELFKIKRGRKGGGRKKSTRAWLSLVPLLNRPAPAVTSLSPPTPLCPLGPPLRHRVTPPRAPLGAPGVSGTIQGTNPVSPLPSGAASLSLPGTGEGMRVLPTIPSPPCSPRAGFSRCSDAPKKPGRGRPGELSSSPRPPRDHSGSEISAVAARACGRADARLSARTPLGLLLTSPWAAMKPEFLLLAPGFPRAALSPA